VIPGPTGIPHVVIVDGKRRSVTAIREDWLVQDRWWTDQPVERHFFELLLEPGRVMTAFHDLRSDEWFGYG